MTRRGFFVAVAGAVAVGGARAERVVIVPNITITAPKPPWSPQQLERAFNAANVACANVNLAVRGWQY